MKFSVGTAETSCCFCWDFSFWRRRVSIQQHAQQTSVLCSSVIWLSARLLPTGDAGLQGGVLAGSLAWHKALLQQGRLRGCVLCQGGSRELRAPPSLCWPWERPSGWDLRYLDVHDYRWMSLGSSAYLCLKTGLCFIKYRCICFIPLKCVHLKLAAKRKWIFSKSWKLRQPLCWPG